MNALPAIAWTLIFLLGVGLPPPAASPAEPVEVVLYLPHESELCLVPQAANLPDKQVQTLVDALGNFYAIPNGVKVLSFTDKPVGILDVSEEFGVALATSGTAGETLMLYALANTVLEAYGLEELTILCEGEVLETGHNRYSAPLHFDLDG